MKHTKLIWLKNLELWLDCLILPTGHDQPLPNNVNISHPYKQYPDKENWLVTVTTNYYLDLDRYEKERWKNLNDKDAL